MSKAAIRKAEATCKERRRRYESGEFDALIGAFVRDAATVRGDPRALGLEVEYWREVVNATKGGA